MNNRSPDNTVVVVVGKLDNHILVQVAVVFGNQDIGHTSEEVGVPLAACEVGVDLGMLPQQGRVEAYQLEWDRVLQ